MVALTLALTLALTDNKDEILDTPIDPNEPVYYLCHQVSFGEIEASTGLTPPMVASHLINTRLVKAKLSPNFPPAMDMIKAAIKSSQDRTGMSLILIKNFIQQHYNDGKIKLVRWAAQ